MSASVTLDTNIVILYLKGDEDVVREITSLIKKDATFILSAITLAELLAFPAFTEKEEQNIYAFASYTRICSVDESVAKKAGVLARTSRLRLGDSIICATALLTGSTLLTQDSKLLSASLSIEVRDVPHQDT